MKRREIMKQLGILPLAGSCMASDYIFGNPLGESAPESKMGPVDGTIFDDLGVVPIINCRGTFTILGGSTERPEVLQAIEAGSWYFVQYDELAYGIGKRLA